MVHVGSLNVQTVLMVITTAAVFQFGGNYLFAFGRDTDNLHTLHMYKKCQIPLGDCRNQLVMQMRCAHPDSSVPCIASCPMEVLSTLKDHCVKQRDFGAGFTWTDQLAYMLPPATAKFSGWVLLALILLMTNTAVKWGVMPMLNFVRQKLQSPNGAAKPVTGADRSLRSEYVEHAQYQQQHNSRSPGTASAPTTDTRRRPTPSSVPAPHSQHLEQHQQRQCQPGPADAAADVDAKKHV